MVHYQPGTVLLYYHDYQQGSKFPHTINVNSITIVFELLDYSITVITSLVQWFVTDLEHILKLIRGDRFHDNTYSVKKG